jgi:hypothetical protein
LAKPELSAYAKGPFAGIEIMGIEMDIIGIMA